MIEGKNITVQYDNANAISDVSFSFPANSYISIVGPNGSGKSTLIKALAGIIPFTGHIQYKAMPVKDMSRGQRAKLIAYLPQSRPVPAIEVEMLVEHGRFPHLDFLKKLTDKDKKVVDKAIELTNISHLLGRKLSHLSGGERQRVYLAMAIAQDAEIFLLDEPMTYLDIQYQMELQKIIAKLHNDGKTIIMAAHDIPQAFSFSQHICVMNLGSVAGYGTPDQMCNHTCIKDVFGFNIEALNVNTKAVYSYMLVRRSENEPC